MPGKEMKDWMGDGGGELTYLEKANMKTEFSKGNTNRWHLSFEKVASIFPSLISFPLCVREGTTERGNGEQLLRAASYVNSG